MSQFDSKRTFARHVLSSNSLFKAKRINIMVAGPPVTGKTTIISFLVQYYPLYRKGMIDEAVLEGVTRSKDAIHERIMPTLGVKVRFLEMDEDENDENQIILWELGRGWSVQPFKAPSEYFRWMSGFVFVCRADSTNSIKTLNDWYERTLQEKRDFVHVTFVHMNDLVLSMTTRDLTPHLREELHENVYFTSMKTGQGLLNLLKGFDLMLNAMF